MRVRSYLYVLRSLSYLKRLNLLEIARARTRADELHLRVRAWTSSARDQRTDEHGKEWRVRAPFSRKRVNNRDANMRSALRDSMGHGNWDDEPRATGIMERDATAARSRPQRDSDLINCGAFSEVFKYRNYFILSYFILFYVILFYFIFYYHYLYFLYLVISTYTIKVVSNRRYQYNYHICVSLVFI